MNNAQLLEYYCQNPKQFDKFIESRDAIGKLRIENGIALTGLQAARLTITEQAGQIAALVDVLKAAQDMQSEYWTEEDEFTTAFHADADYNIVDADDRNQKWYLTKKRIVEARFEAAIEAVERKTWKLIAISSL